MMYLKNLNVVDFKNINAQSVEFSPKINCFVGLNGAGKTNMLDAVYYLSLCKSLSTTPDRYLMRHETKAFMIEADYYTDSTHENILCSYSSESGKRIKRNGKSYSRISEHIGVLPLVSITPGDADLVVEAGEARRRYLDTFISQMDKRYLSYLIKYNSVLSDRNKLLKEDITADKMEVFEIFNMQLSEYADIIYQRRKEMVERLSPIVEQYYKVLSGDREGITLNYSSSLEKAPLLDLLQEYWVRDTANGYTGIGIHRDDIKMSINGFGVKRFGSQGQQKSFLIAMKLAQFDIMCQNNDIQPILLLDDIFDKLDTERIAALMSIVSEARFGQIFISDCSPTRLKEILSSIDVEHHIFSVTDGVVKLSE